MALLGNWSRYKVIEPTARQALHFTIMGPAVLHGLVVLAVVATASAVDECGGYASIARLPRTVVPELMNISLTVCCRSALTSPSLPPCAFCWDSAMRRARGGRRGGWGGGGSLRSVLRL